MTSIQHEIELPADAGEAFELFTARFGDWWPAEYTWSGGTLEQIAIEPRVGGHCYEMGPDGFRCDWGTVTAWEPPHRLAFLWQISPRREPVPDPASASEVEVSFGDGRVALEHRGFERHGDDGDGYARGMGSPQGWPYILGRLAAAAGS
jgi:uncharacterized protein YndB with AHSA1/START domain